MSIERRTAFFISGSGTTLEAILHAIRVGRLTHITPVVVISNHHDALGLTKALRYGVPTEIATKGKEENNEAYGQRLLDILNQYQVDLISQNGWLPLTPSNVVDAFNGRIINQHPGPLDPGHTDFGGPGMYGHRVTCARLIYSRITGEGNFTEATTHYVTSEFDKGALIRMTRMEFDWQSPVTIGELEQNPQRILEQTEQICSDLLSLEHINTISALSLFTQGNNHPHFERQTPLIPDSHKSYVYQAKKLAEKLYPKG